MTQHARLLTPPFNFAVVQLPERQFPGVVVQGDTLSGLVSRLGRMKALLEQGDLDAVAGEIEELEEVLAEALAHYRTVCAAQSAG